MDAPVKVACVQVEPVILERDATIEKMASVCAEAAGEGAQLIVFPEAFVPVYPSSRWARYMAEWEKSEDAKAVFARLARESLELPSEAADRIAAIAREHGVWLAVGANELERGTIYNALLLYAPDGSLALHHRKLMPTNHERMVWGLGDRQGLDRDPDLDRQGGRPDLLGEHDAAGAVRPLRRRRRDLPRAHGGRHRDLARVDPAHRPRGACVRRQPERVPARRELPRFRADRRWAGPAGSRRLGRSSAPTASTWRGRCGTRKASSTPSSIRSSCTPSGSASIRPGHYNRPDVFTFEVR